MAWCDTWIAVRPALQQLGHRKCAQSRTLQRKMGIAWSGSRGMVWLSSMVQYDDSRWWWNSLCRFLFAVGEVVIGAIVIEKGKEL